jgi:hypothetical protein
MTQNLRNLSERSENRLWNKGETADCVLSGLLGFFSYSTDFPRTLGIVHVLPDYFRTPGIFFVLLGFFYYFRKPELGA